MMPRLLQGDWDDLNLCIMVNLANIPNNLDVFEGAFRAKTAISSQFVSFCIVPFLSDHSSYKKTTLLGSLPAFLHPITIM